MDGSLRERTDVESVLLCWVTVGDIFLVETRLQSNGMSDLVCENIPGTKNKVGTCPGNAWNSAP